MTLAPIGIGDFITDPALLGRWFAGPSWDNWRIVLRAALAEPLTDEESATFRDLAEREPPGQRIREAWFAIGRRAGKDSICSALATHSAVFGDFERHLRAGERAVILCLAVDRAQARIVFGYIRAYFELVPLLRPLVERINEDTITLSTGVDIIVATNSFRGVRGRSVALAIFDEVAFWRSDEGFANPDIETYAALRPGLATLRQAGALIVGISTVYRRAGLLFNKWRQHHGRDDDRVLVIRQPAAVFNPTLDPEEIEADIALDPERGEAEWNSVWRSDLSDFLDRALIEAAVDPRVLVRPPERRLRYAAFADPSGGRGDAFTCAIAHAEDGTAVLDCLYERRAPFDPSTAVEEIADLLRSYRLRDVIGDRYAAGWVVEAFAKEGIKYRQSERDRSALYLDALPLFTSGRVRLIDNQRLIHQFSSLERRASRIGKDRVDHGIGGADDAANAAAGALTLVAGRTDVLTLWKRAAGLPTEPTPPLPPRPGEAIVTITRPIYTAENGHLPAGRRVFKATFAYELLRRFGSDIIQIEDDEAAA